jgi:hypothetical protein
VRDIDAETGRRTIPVAQADFSPAGDRLLLMPHPNAEPLVSLVDWPGRRTIAALDPEDLELDSGFDFYGCIVRNGVVVLKTFEEGLVIAGEDLCDVARVPPRHMVPRRPVAGTNLGIAVVNVSGHRPGRMPNSPRALAQVAYCSRADDGPAVDSPLHPRRRARCDRRRRAAHG